MDGLIAVVASSAVVATATSFALETWRERRGIRWQYRRDACLNALRIADAVFSHIEFRDAAGHVIQNLAQARPSIREIRDCQNGLTIACRRTDVLQAFQRCIRIGESNVPLTASAMDDLRQAVRRECGLGRKVSVSQERAYIAYVAEAEEASQLPGRE
jgi:hypothetical protein